MNIPLDNRIDINARKMYDAIISIEAFNSTHRRYSTTNYHPNIMLFKSSKIEHKCINVMSFISKKYLPVDCTTIGYKYGAHHFMYCGRNNGIIYEFDGDLYQLKLSNINIEAKDFNFTKIKTNQTHFWDHTNHHAFAQYLSMSYLKNMNKLFAIKCEWKRSQRIKTQTKCAVFDFIQSKWKWIKPLNTTTILDGYYAYEVCRNQYDMNLIYAVSNKGHTVKYDFIKNKWDMLADNSLSLKPYNKHIVWLDNPHILCCSDGTYFGYFDCRNSKPKWNKHKFANVLNDWSHTDPCVFF